VDFRFLRFSVFFVSLWWSFCRTARLSLGYGFPFLLCRMDCWNVECLMEAWRWMTPKSLFDCSGPFGKGQEPGCKGSGQMISGALL